MKKFCLFAIAGLLALTAALPLAAHHSFAAEFDGAKQLNMTGTVTRIDWVNPHAWIYLDVKDASGNVANWGIETGPPNILYRMGWRRDSLKPGDTIVVSGFAAKDGSHTCAAREVQLPDGRKVFAGSPTDQAPGK